MKSVNQVFNRRPGLIAQPAADTLLIPEFAKLQHGAVQGLPGSHFFIEGTNGVQIVVPETLIKKAKLKAGDEISVTGGNVKTSSAPAGGNYRELTGNAKIGLRIPNATLKFRTAQIGIPGSEPKAGYYFRYKGRDIFLPEDLATRILMKPGGKYSITASEGIATISRIPVEEPRKVLVHQEFAGKVTLTEVK